MAARCGLGPAHPVLLAGAASERRSHARALLASAWPDGMVRVASSAEEALELTRANEAIVILDDLPERGFEPLVAVRAQAGSGGVVALLERPDATTELRLLQLGADECVDDAPLTEDSLFSALGRAAARATQRRAHALHDRGPEIFGKFDRELRLVFVCSAVTHATGRRPAELVGKTSRELGMPGAISEQCARTLERVLSRGVSEVVEVALSAGGKRRIFEARLVPEHDVEGRATHVLLVARDVSARHRREQALCEADRRKDEFMAILAHELRNPLATLAMGLQILKCACHGEQSGRALGTMERQLSQCSRLVEDLLDVSRIAHGKLALRSERVSLRSVVEDALEAARSLVEAAAHTLEVRMGPAPVHVRGDAARLTQVVTNLITNAAKYTPRGGKITIELSTSASAAKLSIADSGMGIAPEMLDQVFVLFSQVKPASRCVQAGLGIGLSVVKRLVELHGGSISVHSDGAGAGTTFEVELPLEPHREEG